MSTRILIYTLSGLIIILLILFAVPFDAEGLRSHALGTDYTGFLLGSTMFAHGYSSASQLYDISLQTIVQQQLLSGSAIHFRDGLLPFVNPPYVAFLATPLAYLSPEVGFLLWDVLQLGLLILSLWLLRSLLPPHYRYLLWLGAFAFLPVYQTLDQAQISPTLFAGITLFWHCLRQGKQWKAGLAIALLLLKPQLLPLFLLYLLYRRYWASLVSFTLATILVYLIAAITSGWLWPGSYLSLLDWLGNNPGHYGSVPELMFTWRGLLARFNIATSFPLLLLTMLTAIALFCAWWRGGRNPALTNELLVGRLELQLAATTLAATLDGFYLYTHDLTILIFSGAVLLGWGAQRGWLTWLTTLLMASLLVPFTFFDVVRNALGPPLDTGFILLTVIALGATLLLLIQTWSFAEKMVT